MMDARAPLEFSRNIYSFIHANEQLIGFMDGLSLAGSWRVTLDNTLGRIAGLCYIRLVLYPSVFDTTPSFLPVLIFSLKEPG